MENVINNNVFTKESDVLQYKYITGGGLMNTTVTFRTDDKLKSDATKVFEALGMNLSTALNLFMKQAVIKQKFPCSLDLEVLNDIQSSYKPGFFELFGTGNDLGFDEEPEDLPLEEVEKLG